jgi:cytoskeletal protein CcmA (bactofilin family)
MPGKEQEITQISNTITIKGDIIGKSDVRVAGVVNGSISIDGELIIEKSGHIEGEIKTKSAVIAGSIKGNIDCSEKMILESSPQFVGNIKTKQLIIQEGAMFQGNCQMGIPSTPAAQPKEKA